MAKPGDATCPACGSRRTVPGWVRGLGLPAPRQGRFGLISRLLFQSGVFGPVSDLFFQFTFPNTLFAYWFDRGERLAIAREFDHCLACGLLWTRIDSKVVEDQIRHATGAEVFPAKPISHRPSMADDELDGPP